MPAQVYELMELYRHPDAGRPSVIDVPVKQPPSDKPRSDP
jgi:serine dehydrogenase proteinase